MKKNGMGYEEAVEFLKNNFADLFFKNWYRWKCAAVEFFKFKEEEPVIDYEKEYYLPIKFINWFDENVRPFILHKNDKEWLRKHRMDRPKSCIWIGKSKRGKTTVARAIENNYYHHLIDGFESFNSNKPLVILDDFHWDFNKYFPSWRCWVGSQTDFTVNPKYGHRRKVAWGHPALLLHNKPFVFKDETCCTFDEEDLEYIKENCVVINTGKRYLWNKPKDKKGELNLIDYKKIKLSYFKCEEQPLEDEIVDAEPIEPPTSPADRDIFENIPVLINQIGTSPYYKVKHSFDQPLKGRLIKRVRRTGSGFWF